MELKPCPLCGGKVRFHQDGEDCRDGCHLIVCDGCLATFDLSMTVDPGNHAETLDYLRLLIQSRWNASAARQPTQGA